MKYFSPGSNYRQIFGLIVVFFIIFASGWLAGTLKTTLTLPIVIAVATCIQVYLVYRWYRHVATQLSYLDLRSRQQIALTSFMPLLSGSYLPQSIWSMEPQAINELLATIQVRQYRNVVECGSGLTTILIGELLRQQGSGCLWSLEEDPNWVKVMQEIIVQRELDTYVRLIYAPRQDEYINGTLIDWYAPDAVKKVQQEVQKLDLLLIDGPKSTKVFARYPALPSFIENMSPSSLIVLDDAEREFEQQILDRWQKEYSIEVELRCHSVRKQAYISIL